jgi:hypothetical protein
MFIKEFVLRAAGASLAACISLAVHPLSAQTASESERLEKLERATCSTAATMRAQISHNQGTYW